MMIRAIILGGMLLCTPQELERFKNSFRSEGDASSGRERLREVNGNY